MNFDAVLFDCDGVLVDSEPLSNAVLRDMFEEAGWVMSPAECMQHFVGKTLRDQRALIETRTGQPFTEDWLQEFYRRRNAVLREQLRIMPGAMQAVVDAHARWGQRLACASGADRHKVELQLDLVGLTPYFAGRIFSGHELPRSKPAPDVYLAAAERVQCASARCLVIEDSPSGVQAGVAAGATVWALVHAPHLADGLRLAGASRLFHSMAELPALWADGA